MRNEEMMEILRQRSLKVGDTRQVRKDKNNYLVMFPKYCKDLWETNFVSYQINQDGTIFVRQSDEENADDRLLNKTRNQYIRIPKKYMEENYNPHEFKLQFVEEGYSKKDNKIVIKPTDLAKARIRARMPEILRQKATQEKLKQQKDMF